MSDDAPPPPVPDAPDAPPPIPTGASTPPAVPASHEPGYGGAPAAQLAYGEAPELRIANPGWRALAFLIDGVGAILLTTLLVFGGLIAGVWASFVAIPAIPLIWAVVATVMTATAGTTPGKAIAGLRVVHVDHGGRIGAWAILRSLVIVSPLLIAYFGIYGLLYGIVELTGEYDIASWFAEYGWLVPLVLWIAMFVLVCVRPNHRGLEDLAGRSVVKRKR